MEVDGDSVVNVQDALSINKAAVDLEEVNAAVVKRFGTDPAAAVEDKMAKADCSTTLEQDQLSKEKDDLLEQIEEVCSDKASFITNTEDISKTTENEFLKKIEEMEKTDDKVGFVDKKSEVIASMKSKNIIQCEALTVDEIVVGDKVLEINEELLTTNLESSVLSSENPIDMVQSNIANKPESSCDKLTVREINSNKDVGVSSSTNVKIQNDLLATFEPTNKASLVKPTGSKGSIACYEKNDEIDEVKLNEDINVFVCIEAGSKQMEIEDTKALVLGDEKVQMHSDENSIHNEAKPMEGVQLNDIDVKETMIVKRIEQNEQNQKFSENIFHMMKSNSSSKVEENLKNERCKPYPELVTTVYHNNKNKNGDLQKLEKISKISEMSISDELKSKSKENTVSSSLTNTPVSSINVFNSTPIEKQFEISSENVSKISDAAELSHTDKEEETTSKPLTKSCEDSTTESGTCATSETDQLSSDGTVKKYIDAIKKYNGMPDTTTDEEENSTLAKNEKPNKAFEIKLDLSGSDLKKDSSYEVNVCCEQNDVRYLSIERVNLSINKNKSQTDKAFVSQSSVQSSSNGSITSLPSYIMPQKVDTSTSASSSSTNCQSLIVSQNKHIILGLDELCNMMINQFTKIKHAVNAESAKEAIETTSEVSTPTSQIIKNKKNSPSAETQSTSASKSKRARKRSMQDDDVDIIPKAKQNKRDASKDTVKKDEIIDSDDSKAGPCVLAKWVDKKFYAGKITSEKLGNKFVVLFEDGASKTLSKESIVFGEGDTLPLQDQQIYALVEEDYESGVVLSIEKSSNKVYYNVKTENTTVKVTASDIYLEVDQAKEIQKIQNIKVSEGIEEEEFFGSRPSRNKRPPTSPSTPEAGYSGAFGKRGGKRQKRLTFHSAPVKCISDDSDNSDTLESTPPASPKEKAGLEMVEGVQPELQNFANESELARMIFISDYKKSQPNCDIDELLGPLPKSNTLFRNKHFLLTCTVGLRPHRFQQEKAERITNNRFMQFSAVPYIKQYILKQLETGGAKVYNYFEDVPKNKYKQCKLISPRPCITAKYVQCLASDIQAISHDWVIDSCRLNKLADISKYQLPAGWSILAETFVQWKIGKNNTARINNQPFVKTFILIAGEHSDFVELWGRVCKAAGAKVRLIKSLDDITPTTKGYMVAESDFSNSIRDKAQYYGIPVVSTVWIVQCIITGSICQPNSHPSLSQLFEDEEI